MPGRVLPELSTRSLLVKIHTSGTDLLLDTQPRLMEDEVSSNIILAHAVEYVLAEQAKLPGELYEAPVNVVDEERKPLLPPSGYFWLSSWEMGPVRKVPKLAFVLSCLSWELGDYPIFIWSRERARNLRIDLLKHHIEALTKALTLFVPKERIFSVFGQAAIVNEFVQSWSKLGIEKLPEPLYSAFQLCCTMESLKYGESIDLPQMHEIRLVGPSAVEQDIESVANLCLGFADGTDYPLEPAESRVEAEVLLKRYRVWIYVVEGEAASICAVTRTSQNVAAVTKVYTSPARRRQGFAKRLVGHVARILLTGSDEVNAISNVVLYVGRNNSARIIYEEIGFQSLSRVEDDNSDRGGFLEIGFSGAGEGYW